MKEKGWDDRLVLYISDEPHFSSSAIRQQMKALCRMIHEVDPAIRIYASTWRHYAEWEDSLDVWGAGHFGFFPVAAMRKIVSGGKSFWFTTDGQFCIDTPYCAVERLMPLYCAVYGAEAYENWGSNWHTFNPWESGCHAYIAESDRPGHHYYVRYPNADGYLMYPGIAGRFSGPVSSIRLEAVRDGVEDYSYWKALKRIEASKGPLSKKSSALLVEFEKLVPIPNAGGRYSKRNLPDPRALSILRRQTGDLIERAKH